MFTLQKTHLVLICGISGLLCVITCISIGVAWTYWSPVLNSCSRMNCGCILYGSSLITIFIGGDIKFCQLVTFCPLVPAVIVFGIALYYAYKIRNYKPHHQIMSNKYPAIRIGSRNRSNEQQQYPCSFIVLVTIILISLFVEACFILEGYTWTCKEYKKHVIRYLNATGDLATILNDRLPCSAMYDFLDYLQPDILIRQPGIRSVYQHRTNHINTAAFLQTSLLTSWINVIIWSLVIIFIGICKVKSR